MEVYNFYQAAVMTASLFTEDYIKLFVISDVVALLLWAAFFVLQGFGIYVMAKRAGVKKRGLAFVPFVNIWYIGKLAGECNFFGQRMKRGSMYAMIAQILATVLCILTVASEQYLVGIHKMRGLSLVITDMGYSWDKSLVGFDLFLVKFYEISGYLLPIFQLFFEIFIVVLMMALCKKYAPKNYMILGILVLFLPISRFIIIFVLRNRQPIDYDAYMRARHEAYIRSQQQYYNRQNPYGNPYGGQYNTYGQGAPNAQKPEEPFSEFGSQGGASADEPFSEMNGSSDDFFS